MRMLCKVATLDWMKMGQLGARLNCCFTHTTMILSQVSPNISLVDGAKNLILEKKKKIQM